MAQVDEQLTEQSEGIDVTIANETRRILTEWVGMDPDLTPDQRQAQIDREAMRLQQLTENAAAHFEAQGTAQWQQANPGRTPEYWDVVQAKESGWRAAREMVLAEELYPQVTPEVLREITDFETEMDAQVEAEYDRAFRARDRDRWKTLNVRPRPVATRIVERVWLEKPGWFRSLAKALVAQRIEDNQPVPITAFDPVAGELAAMIEEEMRVHPPADPNLPF
ncbi:hypothetical protein [Rhodococcus marinonascens]|uniref:hypothetical protein n=1 Tax=Rhodococcus marinonascens TaxID=38311 RepID=UPI0009335EB7|nr:hypothetical protein [Rhodococcus marinonascens]